MKRTIIAATALLCGQAMALDGMAVSIGSRHFGDSAPCNGTKEYNESNPGLGFRIRRQPSIEYEIGVYKNSLAVESYYGSVTWLPYRKEYLELGVMGGLVSGYCNNDSSVMVSGAFVMNVWPTKNFGIQLLGIPPISDLVPGVVGLRVLANF
jgi:hypothetical protein